MERWFFTRDTTCIYLYKTYNLLPCQENVQDDSYNVSGSISIEIDTKLYLYST